CQSRYRVPPTRYSWLSFTITGPASPALYPGGLHPSLHHVRQRPDGLDRDLDQISRLKRERVGGNDPSAREQHASRRIARLTVQVLHELFRLPAHLRERRLPLEGDVAAARDPEQDRR